MMIFTSCSLAPFSSNKSGRSIGPGNMQFELGGVNASYYMKFIYGASKRLDIGYVMEFGGFTTSGIYGKYSFINQPTGLALAMEGGYGSSETSNYYYVGAVGSLAFSKYFELFINPRAVKASTDSSDVDLNESVGNVTVTDYNLTYLYGSAGMNIWFSDFSGLSIYMVYVKGDGLETAEDTTAAATILFKL